MFGTRALPPASRIPKGPEGGMNAFEGMGVVTTLVFKLLEAMLGMSGGSPTPPRSMTVRRSRSSSSSPLGCNPSHRRATDDRDPRLPNSIGDSLLQAHPEPRPRPSLPAEARVSLRSGPVAGDGSPLPLRRGASL